MPTLNNNSNEEYLMVFSKRYDDNVWTTISLKKGDLLYINELTMLNINNEFIKLSFL